MPSTPLTCCSMGAATVSATTCALAPGYAAETSTVGGAISGYWAIGKVNSAMPPPKVITMDRTEAKIGRLMKKRENTVTSLGGYRSRKRERPVAYAPGSDFSKRHNRRIEGGRTQLNSG